MLEGERGYASRLLDAGPPRTSLAHGALVVGALSAAAALAWRGLAATHPVAASVTAGYCLAEAAFYCLGKLRFRSLSRLPTAGPDSALLKQHFERFLELRDVFCIREFLSGWFMGASADAIPRGNVEEFVAYGFHCRLLGQLSGKQRAQIRQFVDEVEAAWGVSFQPGFDPDLPFMAHVWEPLRTYHKPLIMFALTELLARAAHLLMFLMGFRPGRQGRFTYWHAPPLAGKAGTGAGAANAGQLPLSPPLSPLPPRGAAMLRRHSTSEVVAEAVHHAAGAVHNAAEHALDATLTVTSTAAAVVAAQHPHGLPTPLSPHAAPAAAARRAASPAPPRSPDMATAPAGRAASSPPRLVLPAAAVPAEGAGAGISGAGAGVGAAASSSLRRRTKNDSAADYTLAAAAAAAGAEGVESATEAAAADAEVRVAASPFRLASLDLPRASPSDSASSMGGATAATAAAASGGGAAGAAGGTRPDVPIVFLHGVGFGVLPYLHLVRDIQQACCSTPVLMVEVPHVALRLCWEAQGVDDVAHAVAAMLRRHGYRRCCVVGHSYGTFVASRLCQLHPELVHSASLLDPVAMLTCYPQLLYNFIYKEPTAANFSSVLGAMDLLRFLCSRDVTIALAFCRKFQWSELMLWPQDLPRRSLVVLSGQDDLVPSELVMAHIKLTGHPAKVMHHPDLGHGGILLCPPWQALFVQNLRAMLLPGR
ncbi:hypothetical protein ABPG75_013966 [Micractinium tetrahymenae]